MFCIAEAFHPELVVFSSNSHDVQDKCGETSYSDGRVPALLAATVTSPQIKQQR